jgi:hypothetical protein
VRRSPIHQNHLQDLPAARHLPPLHRLGRDAPHPQLPHMPAVVPQHRALLHRSRVRRVLSRRPNHAQPADGNHATTRLHVEAAGHRGEGGHGEPAGLQSEAAREHSARARGRSLFAARQEHGRDLSRAVRLGVRDVCDNREFFRVLCRAGGE